MSKSRSLLVFLLLLTLIGVGVYAFFVRSPEIALISTSAELPANSTYDVVVVGGGASGVAAAIQAARQDSKVVILEETDWLGGQMSAGAVSTMDEGAGAWQRSGGIYGELYQKTKKYYDNLGISTSTCYHSSATFCPEPIAVRNAIGEIIGETQSAGKKLEVYTLTKVTELIKSGTTVTGIKTSNGKSIQAKVVIDATEYGDLLPLSGAPYRIGNKTNTTIGTGSQQESICIQDITYSGVIKKDPSLPGELKITQESTQYDQHTAGFRTNTAISVPLDKPFLYDSASYPMNWNSQVGYRGMPNPEGKVTYLGSDYNKDGGKITKTGLNWTNDFAVNARYLLDSQYRAAQNCSAKAKTIDFIRYAQTEMQQPLWGVDLSQNYAGSYNQSHTCNDFPAEWKATEQALPVIPYVRESLRLIGIKTLGTKDIPTPQGVKQTTARFSDAIGVADYGVDLHGCLSASTLETNLDNISDLGKGKTFQIPLDALIPESIDGFLTAEKNISQSRLINGATRLQPTVMTIGQAAGSLAAHAVRLNTTPRRVQPILIQYSLAQSKLRLAVEQVNSASDHWAYPHLQVALTHGITPNAQALPDEAINRGEIAHVLTKAAKLNLSNIPITPTFTDTPNSHPYYISIEAFYRAGITTGCSTNPLKFCPDSPVTRAEGAVLIAKILALNTSIYEGKPSSFIDIPTELNWAIPSIEALYKQGIISGCKSDPLSYCPSDPITRAQSWVLGTKVLMNKLGETRDTTSEGVMTPEAPEVITLPSGNTIPLATNQSSTFLPGDLNTDHKVNLADYNLLISKYGNPYTLADYNNIIKNYGKTSQ
jgi:hypothetical protein